MFKLIIQVEDLVGYAECGQSTSMHPLLPRCKEDDNTPQ